MRKSPKKFEGWYINQSDGDIEYRSNIDRALWLYVTGHHNNCARMVIQSLILGETDLPEETVLENYFKDWMHPTEDERILWEMEWPFKYIHQKVLDAYNKINDNSSTSTQ